MPRQLVGEWSTHALNTPLGKGAKTVQIGLGRHAARVEAYAKQHNQTISGVLRQLIRWGLQGNGHLEPVKRDGAETLSTVLSKGTLLQCASLQAYLTDKIPRGTILRALVVESLRKAEQQDVTGQPSATERQELLHKKELRL